MNLGVAGATQAKAEREQEKRSRASLYDGRTGGDVVIYRQSMCRGVYVRNVVGAGEKEIVLIYA